MGPEDQERVYSQTESCRNDDCKLLKMVRCGGLLDVLLFHIDYNPAFPFLSLI